MDNMGYHTVRGGGGGGGEGWHPRGGAELTNVYCSTCIQFEMASCSRFVAPELPLTPHQPLPDLLFLSESSVRRISCSVPSSGRGLISGPVMRRMTWHTASFPRRRSRMTQKAESSYSAVQSTKVPREPIQITEKEYFPCFARTDRHFTPLFAAFGSGRTTPK